jgi:MarR family 2-MHQ and catechol resistance regulon transcriptional repressor
MKESVAPMVQACAPSAVPDRIMSLFLQAAHAIERRLDEALDAVELSVPKYSALSKLVQAGEPLALSELAARLTCVRSNITQLVDRMEADGLVRRVEDPRDRRSVRAALTPLGRERQAAGAELMEKLHEEVAEKLSGIDHGALVRALTLLR